MITLTEEILEKNGFINNHPERVFKKYYYSDPKTTYRIVVEEAFIPRTNTLGWSVSAWSKKDEIINKKISVSVISFVEELQSAIDLCNINLLIYCK